MTWRSFPILRGPILLGFLAAACSPDSEPPQIDPPWLEMASVDCDQAFSRCGASPIQPGPARNEGA